MTGNNNIINDSIYSPSKDGIVTDLHIFLVNGYQPMATLKFAYGKTVTIEWDNIDERAPYLCGINAYTIILDDRAIDKLEYEKNINKTKVVVMDFDTVLL